MAQGFDGLKIIFELLDEDDKGYITAQQLTEMMNEHDLNHNEQDVKYMISVLDVEGTGNLDLSAFRTAMKACNFTGPKLGQADNSAEETDNEGQADADEPETEGDTE